MWCPLTKLSLLRTLDATKASHLIANPKKCPLSKGSVTVTFAQICDCEQSNSYYLPKNSVFFVFTTISPPAFMSGSLSFECLCCLCLLGRQTGWSVGGGGGLSSGPLPWIYIVALPYYHTTIAVLPYHITILHFYVALPSGPRPSLTMGNELLRPGADTKLQNSLLNES